MLLSRSRLSSRCLSAWHQSGSSRMNAFKARRASIPPPGAALHLSALSCKVFEPDYLDEVARQPTKYPLVNIQIRGYNFEILENYQAFIHRTCENIGIDVNEAWATPCRTIQANTFQPGGVVVKESYQLNIYERNVQVVNLRSIDAPQLVDILRITVPEGVTLSVHEHQEEHYEARFIPDAFVEAIKEELLTLEDKDEELKEKRKEKLVEKEKRKAAMLLATFEEDE